MFLISNPQPAVQADFYEVELDGNVVRSDAQREGDMVRLHHELVGISMGNHSARVKCVNGWEEGQWSLPFDFIAQSAGKVSGIGLSAD